MNPVVNFNPAQKIEMYFRIRRAGTKTFTFLDGSGAAINISGFQFAFYLKDYEGATQNKLALTVGSGLTVGGAGSNVLSVALTVANTALNEGEYYCELFKGSTSKTYISGKAFAHNGKYDGKSSDSTSVVVTDSDENITIVIQDGSGDHFRGTYVSLVALQAAIPTGTAGDYADVDAGVGTDVQRYIWDDDDNDWIQGSGGGGISGLTATRVPFASTPTTLTDSDNLKFVDPTLSVRKTKSVTGSYAPGSDANIYMFDMDPEVAAGANNQVISVARLRHRNVSGGAFTGTLWPFLVAENSAGSQYPLQIFEAGVRIGYTAIASPTNPLEVNGKAAVTSLMVNGVNYFAPILYQNNVSSSLTGTTSETIMDSFQLPANTLQANDILLLTAIFTKSGTAGVATGKFRHSTPSLDLSGSSLGQINSGSASTVYNQFERKLVLKNSLTSQEIYGIGSNVNTDVTSGTTALTSLSINFAAVQHIMFTITLGNAGDTVTLRTWMVQLLTRAHV